MKQYNEENELNSLLNKVKKLDRFDTKLIGGVKALYIFMIAVYTCGIFCRAFTDEMTTGVWGALLSVVGMVVVYYGLTQIKKLYMDVDFSVSLLDRMKAIAYRYQMFPKESYIPSFGVILMIVGITIEKNAYASLLIFLQSPAMIGLVVGLCIGTIRWWIKHRPLREQALSLVNELESGE